MATASLPASLLVPCPTIPAHQAASELPFVRRRQCIQMHACSPVVATDSRPRDSLGPKPHLPPGLPWFVAPLPPSPPGSLQRACRQCSRSCRLLQLCRNPSAHPAHKFTGAPSPRCSGSGILEAASGRGVLEEEEIVFPSVREGDKTCCVPLERRRRACRGSPAPSSTIYGPVCCVPPVLRLRASLTRT